MFYKNKSFRGWDWEEKRMVFWTLNDLLCCFGEPEYRCIKDRPSIFFEWMEFTGLQDKEGKDIYEGDIVQSIDNSTIEARRYIDKVKFIKSPEFANNIFIFPFVNSFVYQNNNNKLATIMDSTDYKIIGNIYENPELLEKK